jgi:hypothetical protein
MMIMKTLERIPARIGDRPGKGSAICFKGSEEELEKGLG